MEANGSNKFYDGFTVVTSIPYKPSVLVNAKVGDVLYVHGLIENAEILSAKGNSVSTIKLEKSEIAGGKEADVYETSAKCKINGQTFPLLVKIYKETSPRVKAKMQLFCSKGLYCKEIAFPIAWLSDSSSDDDKCGCFGILMPKISNAKSLDEYVTSKKTVTVKERLEIVRQILNHFMFLRKHNIQPVDFNLSNFIINEKSKEITLIDTDSFQIENFPCQVVSPDLIFDHPKRIEEGFYNYSMELRNYDEMVYGLCVLIFKVMIKSVPYKISRSTPWESISDPYNILAGNFRFRNNKGPTKSSTELWQNCPEKFKNFFMEVFDSSGSYFYKEDNNLYLEDLKDLFDSI